jgi:hypothetical protein
MGFSWLKDRGDGLFLRPDKIKKLFLRRDDSNFWISAEPNVPHFEILSGILVNGAAAFAGLNERYCLEATRGRSPTDMERTPVPATFNKVNSHYLRAAVLGWLTAWRKGPIPSERPGVVAAITGLSVRERRLIGQASAYSSMTRGQNAA